MARIFWKGLREDRLSDGRDLLTVEFSEKTTGVMHEWTPRWAEVFELIDNAHDVEVRNEAGSRYVSLLQRAQRSQPTTPKPITPKPITPKPITPKPIPQQRPAEPNWVWCFECEFHPLHPAYCGMCYACSLGPEYHQR